MKKRILCIVLGLSLVLGLFSGCANNNNNQQTSQNNNEQKPTEQKTDETWKPDKDISMLIGYGAGGGMDVMSRLLIPTLQEELGVNVIPTNMPGSNSAISAEALMKAPADGYNLWAYSAGCVTFPATGLSDYYYKDIQMLAITQGCNPVILVPKDSELDTMEKWMAAVKEGNTIAGNSGIGGIWHVPQMMIVNAIGGTTTYVPYDGGKASALSAAQGEVDWSICDLSEGSEFIKDGMVKVLCTYALEDIDLEGYGTIPSILKWLPDLKDIIPSTNGFRGIGMKRGAPENVVKAITDALKVGVTSEAFIKATTDAGITPLAYFGEEAEKLTEEATKYACWAMYDLGLADRDPAEVGLER